MPGSVSFRGFIQNFRRASPSLSYAESPRVLSAHFPFTNVNVCLPRQTCKMRISHLGPNDLVRFLSRSIVRINRVSEKKTRYAGYAVTRYAVY